MDDSTVIICVEKLKTRYGGAVGLDAVQGLSFKDCQAKNLPSGVIHMLYLSAYLLERGQSVWKIVEKSGIAQDRIGLVTIEEDGTWLPMTPFGACTMTLTQKIKRSKSIS